MIILPTTLTKGLPSAVAALRAIGQHAQAIQRLRQPWKPAGACRCGRSACDKILADQRDLGNLAGNVDLTP
jgi:hypothetical protein